MEKDKSGTKQINKIKIKINNKNDLFFLTFCPYFLFFYFKRYSYFIIKLDNKQKNKIFLIKFQINFSHRKTNFLVYVLRTSYFVPDCYVNML